MPDELRLPTTPGSPRPVADLTGIDVCSAHGEPVVRRVDLAVAWRPPQRGQHEVGGVVVTGPGLGSGRRALRSFAQAVVVLGRGWPVCARCRAARRRGAWPAAVLLAGGLLAVAVAVLVRLVVGSAQAGLAWPFGLGLLAVLLSVVPFVLGSWLRITRARGTPDASAVLVVDPHPAFRAAVAASGP